MKFKFRLIILACCLIGFATPVWCWQANAPASRPKSNRVVTVADSISMTTIDNPNYSLGTWGRDDVAAFSPDGKRFVIIVKQGNLEQNTVEYSLLLYQTEEALSSSPAEVLTSLSSSSLRPAIEALTWLDERRIAFLGENPGETHQLYVIDCDSKRLQQRTNHATNVQQYAFNQEGDIFFTAEKSAEALHVRGGHLIVDQENLYQLVSGVQLTNLAGADLFVMKKGHSNTVPLRTKGMISSGQLWPSPDGRYLALCTLVRRDAVPTSWFGYQTVSQGTLLSREGPSQVEQYELIDLRTGDSQPLVDAPLAAWYSNLAWSDDGRSVVVSGTDLPLGVPDLAERKLREAKIFVAEVEIPSRRIAPITHEDAIIRHWRIQTNELVLQLTNHQSFSNFEEGALVAYRRTREGWKQQDAGAIEEKQNSIEITVEEDMNTPPRLFAKNVRAGTKSLLLDPNPQFGDLRFGRVEEIKCKSADGHEITAGLYRPPDYVTGKRYPLVIQTHGWTSDRFWIDGPYTTTMAAQPLAAKGFVVVQVGDDFTAAESTPNEGKVAMDVLEGIIDYLNATELIDSSRIGIVAFSATGVGVTYAITHSRYRFRATVLSDTDDAGYFSYLSAFNLNTGLSQQFEAVNGGAFFGGGQASWLKEAPEFSLDKIDTAMLLEPHSGMDLLLLWEWYVGFRRLGKPVEMVFMPDAGHVVIRPQDRIVSQGGAVDWFDFWLKGEEDPDPAKKEQYARWHELRKLQDQSTKNSEAVPGVH